MTHVYPAEIGPRTFAVIADRSLFAVLHSAMSAGTSETAHTLGLNLALMSAKDAGAT